MEPERLWMKGFVKQFYM